MISRTATAGSEYQQLPLRKTQCLSDAERSLSIAVADWFEDSIAFMVLKGRSVRGCERKDQLGLFDLAGEACLDCVQAFEGVRIGID